MNQGHSDGAIARNVAIAATTLRRYNAVMLWHCDATACDARTLQLAKLQLVMLRRNSTLQLMMLRRYGAATRDATTLQRCGDAAVAMLQLAMLQRCDAAARDAGALWRCSPRQRRTAAHYAKMASDTRARDSE